MYVFHVKFVKNVSIFLAMSSRHLFCKGECSNVGFGPKCLEHWTEKSWKIVRNDLNFLLKKLLLEKSETSGCLFPELKEINT